MNPIKRDLLVVEGTAPTPIFTYKLLISLLEARYLDSDKHQHALAWILKPTTRSTGPQGGLWKLYCLEMDSLIQLLARRNCLLKSSSFDKLILY